MEMLENHFLYIYIYKGKVHRVECPKGTRHTQKKKKKSENVSLAFN